MSTKGHESEAIRVEGVQHSFQKFKDDLIGIPNITEAVYYTQSEANAYNALLTGALDDVTPLTSEQASAYNQAVTGASKVAGDTLTTEEANAYNATLDGAVTTADVKTPAVPKKAKDYVDDRLNGKQDAISDLKVLGNAYLTCSTAGNTAAKTIDDTGYILVPGCIVSVLFVNAFTSSNPTLNINDTGAKPIYYKGSAVQPGLIRANSVVVMQYNGTNYNIISYDSFARLVDDDAVDLGLPSGLLWCSHNVGAINAKDSGLYFSWGNTDGHSEGGSYDFTLNAYNKTEASTIPSIGSYTLGSDFDAARRIQGGIWRTPSWSEYQELFNNCQAEYTTLDSVVGMLFTSSINGNTLFFPKAGKINGTTLDSTIGECWTSDNYTNNTARVLRFDSSGIVTNAPRTLRYIGVPVRAVM